jgi:hypothetical protein
MFDMVWLNLSHIIHSGEEGSLSLVKGGLLVHDFYLPSRRSEEGGGVSTLSSVGNVNSDILVLEDVSSNPLRGKEQTDYQ